MISKPSISEILLDQVKQQGCKTIFGVPGAYSIHFVDHCTSGPEPVDFILCSHEGGATFMAQGYSHVTGSLGCVVTTAGPAALNTVTALASAKSDGDRVLLIHGENPKSKRGQGALQDATSFNCEVKDVLAPVVHQQFLIDSASDFINQFEELSKALSASHHTTHLMIGADVFPAQPILPARNSESSKSTVEQSTDKLLTSVEDLLIESESMLVLVGHGVYQANCVKELQTFLDPLEIPTMVTARAAACLDPKTPYYLGQHSIFSHERVAHLMKEYGGKKTDLLLVIGSSLGEFASNGGASYLKDIPNIIHVSTDSKCFGRLGGHAINIQMDAKLFLEKLINSSRLKKAQKLIKERNQKRLSEFRSTVSMNLYSRLNDDLTYTDDHLTGQRLVHAVSDSLTQCLDEDTVVNVVADTGSSKLYAAHYMSYKPGSRCIMNSGTIDCLGFGLSAAIGAAIGSRDIGENALTICFVGDGGLLMNNELNTLAANASLKSLRLIVFVLNDAALSYVHQGFAAVMGRPLESTRFHHQIDFSMMASSFGLSSTVVDQEYDITPGFFSEIISENNFPFIVDCRISNKVVGPGLSRYNQVRSLLGKQPLSPKEAFNALSLVS